MDISRTDINYVTSKIAKTVGILFKARHFIGKDLLLSLYYSLIDPNIIYCNIIYCCLG